MGDNMIMTVEDVLIPEYLDNLENCRYVGGGSVAQVMYATALSLLIKIAKVAERRGQLKYHYIIDEIGEYRDRCLQWATLDSNLYKYCCEISSAKSELKISEPTEGFNQQVSLLSSIPSHNLIAMHESDDMDIILRRIPDVCNKAIESDLKIAMELMTCAVNAAKLTCEINGHTVNTNYIFTEKDIEMTKDVAQNILKNLVNIEEEI